MLIRPCLRFSVVFAAAVAIALGAQAGGSPARAQGRLDARYAASLAGIPVGRGAWVIDIDRDKYHAAASGATAGLLRLFSSGEGTGAARGTVVNGRLVPATYAASILTSKRKNEVRIALHAGTVKDVSVEPPVMPDSKRIPLRDVHRRGVLDPMTASLVWVTGSGNPLVPGSCQHKVAVFDGRMRYDLRLAYKRMDHVKAQKGYDGPALVCAIYFSPIAGFDPGRVAIKYLSDLRDMEIWLVPIAGTSILVPFRLTIPTPFGLAMLEATQFLTVAHQTRSAVSGATTR